MIEKNDILLLLSGGSFNTDSAKSLGGDPAATLVTKRLFSDVSAADSKAGSIDYRCIYLTNDDDKDSLYDVAIVPVESSSGCSVSLGVLSQDEIQQLTIMNGANVTSGSTTLNYGSRLFSFDFDEDIDVWAGNLEYAIRSIRGLEDVSVSGDISGTRAVFSIEFVESAGNRYHPLLEISEDDLSPAVTYLVQKTVIGSPINTIASEIDNDRVAPIGVTFSSESISIGVLRAGEMCPIWIRRTCEAGLDSIEGDGFLLRISGSPIG